MIKINRMSRGCSHDNHFFIDNPDGFKDYLILFVKSKAYFIINEKKTITEPNTFIIFNRNSPQMYGATDNENYSNAWIEFESDDLDSLLSESSFDTTVYIGTSIDIDQYFKLISDCYFNSNNARTEDYLIKAMLSEIFTFSKDSANTPEMPHLRELLDLRQNVYSHPEKNWTVDLMAQRLHVSKPYLQDLYKTAFSITCMADVINSRIEMAKTCLNGKSMSIDEIGYRCGYKSPVHFSRQFKQITGCSPSKWK
ncbi:MAG: AraC family transcriptional regulator [Ruminococcus sp.]|nr:AraC family transcriptional regulator [Ruminococcus sp.]